MNVFGALPPAEQARQLANPEGEVGIAVAEWMNGNNREGNAQILALLRVQPGDRVLEIGFGNGRAALDVVAQAAGVQYDGIDISPTMVAEAARFNAALVAAGRTSFQLACAERIPFEDALFDRVFSIGVIHFWGKPLAPLGEVRRVVRPGGRVVMGALDPRSAPPFAREDHGFYLRSAEEWREAFGHAGFMRVETRAIENEQRGPDGSLVRRYAVRILAQP